MTEIIETHSYEETFDIGYKIGREAEPGSIYTLIGDLGVGKTVLCKGIAKGIGIEENVSSPTFTIVQQYDEGRLPFFHFDVYRIEDPEEMFEVGLDEYLFSDGVSVIEWADMIKDLIPDNHTRIEIKKNHEKGFDYRLITISKSEA